MEDGINEYISVKASFSSGVVFPFLILYRQREISIQKVTLSYKTYEGDSEVYNFSLQGSGAVYHVLFYPQRMVWKIAGIRTEEN